MSLDLNENKNKKEFKKVEEGSHIAVPVQIIDFGNQLKTDWQTGEPVLNDKGEEVIQHRVWITSEFPEQTDTFEDVEKPLWLGKEYTVSTHEKANLVELIKATNSKAKNLSEIIGIPYTATVGLTSGGNPKITACTPCPNKLVMNDEMVAKEDIKLFNEPVIYSLEDGQNDVYSNLPDWMKEKIDNQVDELKPQF